jgi:hypothetical protein
MFTSRRPSPLESLSSYGEDFRSTPPGDWCRRSLRLRPISPAIEAPLGFSIDLMDMAQSSCAYRWEKLVVTTSLRPLLDQQRPRATGARISYLPIGQHVAGSI